MQPKPYNPDFIRLRAKRVVENRQEIMFNFSGKSQFKEGYEIGRLVSPNADQINEDFLCAICQSKCFLQS